MRTHAPLKQALMLTWLTALTLLTVAAQTSGAPRFSAEKITSGVRGAAGSISFLPVVTYDPGGFEASMIAVADVNRDGKADLVVVNCGSCSGPIHPGSVSVMLGKGDGTFQSPLTYAPGGETPLFVVVADVNTDGKLDLIMANRCADSSCLTNSVVSVLLGHGDGTFDPAVSYDSGGLFTSSVAVADVNGDSRADLLVANNCADSNCDGSVDVLLGNGDGTFQPGVSYLTGGYGAVAVAVADVNGDGKPDLLVATDDPKCQNGMCSSEGAVAVMLGAGDGTFQPPQGYDTGGIAPAGPVIAADVNHDHKLDLVVENTQCCGSPFGLAGVLLGNGDGSFQTVVTYPSGSGGWGTSAQVADVNGDDNPDLIVTDQSAGADGNNHGLVGVLLGNGDGSFQAAVTYDTGGFQTNWVAVADMNSDGKPDLLVANECADNSSACAQASVGVLLNATTLSRFSTSTALSSSPNPALFGQSVTWTAVVTSSGSVVPTGTVKFRSNGHTIGSSVLTPGGIATLTKPAPNAGSYPVIAVYTGDATNERSTSSVLNQTILPTPSSATLVSSLNPSRHGQAVTFTATITSSTVIPKGSVTFTAGIVKAVLGRAPLNNGKAVFTTSGLPVGSTIITATYFGDSNVAKSVDSLTQSVEQE